MKKKCFLLNANINIFLVVEILNLKARLEKWKYLYFCFAYIYHRKYYVIRRGFSKEGQLLTFEFISKVMRYFILFQQEMKILKTLEKLYISSLAFCDFTYVFI